jgi:hypothetical protein
MPSLEEVQRRNVNFLAKNSTKHPGPHILGPDCTEEHRNANQETGEKLE